MLLFVRYQVILFDVGENRVARRRRQPSVLLALLLAPAAVFFAAGADVHPDSAAAKSNPGGTTCCLELVAATPEADDVSAVAFAASRMPVASRWRVDLKSRFLPVGKAPENGLQVKTILVERSISLAFPEIQNMGGVRPDSLRWHPEGLAVDVMIPNPSSSEGIALGNQIVAYVLKNAERFGIQDAIWRGVYYTPSGPRGSAGGHFDHVHVTTTGGGYPTGEEVYYR